MEVLQVSYSYIAGYKIIQDKLGGGLHGDVFLGQKDGKQYAIKKYNTLTATIETLQNQVKNLMKLNDHPHIVKIIDFIKDASCQEVNKQKQSCFAIILEYLSGGQIYDYLSICGEFSQNVARTYFLMILDAIQYMHSKGIVHRDLKPENIVLSEDFNLKIVDFGFAKQLVHNSPLKSKLGTQPYNAPEKIEGSYDGKVADLFSIGVILFHFVVGNIPFSKATKNDYYYKYIYNHQFNKFWSHHQNHYPNTYFPDDFKNLIQKMLAFNPQQRLTYYEVRNHEWTKKDAFTLNQIQSQFFYKKQMVVQKNQQKKQRLRQQQIKRQNAFQLGNRSTSQYQNFYNIFDKYYFDQSTLKQCHPNPNDLILDTKPTFFIALLQQYLTSERQQNIIADHLQKQYFEIDFDSTKLQIKVLLDYSIQTNDQELEIIIQLFKNYDDKLKLRFLKTQVNNLKQHKLIRLIKNHFDYLVAQ